MGATVACRKVHTDIRRTGREVAVVIFPAFLSLLCGTFWFCKAKRLATEHKVSVRPKKERHTSAPPLLRLWWQLRRGRGRKGTRGVTPPAHPSLTRSTGATGTATGTAPPNTAARPSAITNTSTSGSTRTGPKAEQSILMVAWGVPRALAASAPCGRYWQSWPVGGSLSTE